MPALSTLAADIVMSMHFALIGFLLFGWLSRNQIVRRAHLGITLITLGFHLFSGTCPLWTLEASLRSIDVGAGFWAGHGFTWLSSSFIFALIFLLTLISIARNFAFERLRVRQVLVAVLVMMVMLGKGGECFIAGTEISMADGSVKTVEEIELGDVVLGMDGTENTVISLYQYTLGIQPLYSINDSEHFVTKAHPFWTTQGWQAIDPTAAKKWNPDLKISKLDKNDVLILENGEKVVKAVKAKRSNYFTAIYNFTTDGNQTYYADGYLVHNKGGGTGSSTGSSASSTGVGTASGIGDQGNGHAGDNGSNGFGGTVGGSTGGGSTGGEGDCFIAGTQITMADGSMQDVEDVQIGESVKTVNTETMEIEAKPVLDLLSQYHTGEGDDFTIRVKFANGSENQNTNTHPYYVENKGWASYLPELTLEKYGLTVELLESGDTVYELLDGGLQETKIIEIEEIHEPVQTYNLSKVADNSNFFAEGILVHNKGTATQNCINMGCVGATSCGRSCYDEGCCSDDPDDPDNPDDPDDPPACIPDCSCATSTCAGTDCDDGCSDTCSGTMDCTPPTFNSSPMVFAADDNKSISLSFSDPSTPLSYDITACGQNFSASPLIGDFSSAGKCDLSFTVCDSAPPVNCLTETHPDFFHIVANVPDWNTGFSEITTSSGPKIADNADYHTVNVQLVDQYSNPVISESGIKNVSVNFNFNDDSQLNQIDLSDTTDSSSHYSTTESFANLGGALDNNPGGDSTGWLQESVGGDGMFEVKVHSYAPTSAGYGPIASDGFDLNFESIDYKIENISAYTSVGATAAVAQPLTTVFEFSPTLTSTPEALVWDGSSYAPDADGIKNITVNAPKRFSVSLDNADDTNDVTISSPSIGVALNSGVSSNITWVAGTTALEEIAGSTLTENLTLDTNTNLIFDLPGVLKDLTSWIVSIADGNVQTLRFRATPELGAASTGDNLNTILQTYACYTVDGTISKTVCHRSEKLESGGTDAQLHNPGIEIIGSVLSSGGTASKQSGAALNQSIGDMAQIALKNNINRSTAVLTKDISANACLGVSTITDLASDWGFTYACAYTNGDVLYFKGDVTLNLSGNLPSGAKTLLIKGGNLTIKSNLTYPVGGGSFGVIVLKDGTTGGNIFLEPSVTKIAGAFYADGSLISVNADGEYGEDTSSDCSGVGFCDRSYELRNQLYWQGLIATQNTIGGADKSPIECPNGITCSSSEAARIYDLAYLRTFHTDSGGAQPYVGSGNSLVVEYDSRIQNNPPPLFATSSGESGGQLGSNLLNVDSEIIQPKPSRSLWDIVKEWF